MLKREGDMLLHARYSLVYLTITAHHIMQDRTIQNCQLMQNVTNRIIYDGLTVTNVGISNFIGYMFVVFVKKKCFREISLSYSHPVILTFFNKSCNGV